VSAVGLKWFLALFGGSKRKVSQTLALTPTERENRRPLWCWIGRAGLAKRFMAWSANAAIASGGGQFSRERDMVSLSLGERAGERASVNSIPLKIVKNQKLMATE